MASSSKQIQMPLVIVVSIGAVFSLVASVVFGLAWYEYEQRVVIRKQVLGDPTHGVEYQAMVEPQIDYIHRPAEVYTATDAAGNAVQRRHIPIDRAMDRLAAEHAGDGATGNAHDEHAGGAPAGH